MEENPLIPLESDHLHDFPDLNVGYQVNETNWFWDQAMFEELVVPNDNNVVTSTGAGGEQTMFVEELVPNDDDIDNANEVAAATEVESSNLTVEEMEKRLEIGETVTNEHIAYALYCQYARAKGFSVRKGKNEKFGDGSGIKAKTFLCSRQGTKDEKRSTNKIPDYQKPTSRCNCDAKIRIARRKDDVWKVTTFHKTHNHEMVAPDQTHLLRSARKLTENQEYLLGTMVNCKIPLAKAIKVLETVAQGKEHVGFIPNDAYDCIYRARRKTKIENEDTHELIQHFINKSNSEPYFYWNVEVDEDNRLMNFFFRDYRCLVDYECFGDVLTFDTTYKTNKYELICAPFIGINNHNQNVMFGLAFLSNETESSFEWLFRTFLESMNGKQPESIITDQCKAMMNAIATVFPKAHHRLCQWHIDANSSKHFGSLKSDKTFKYLWKKCMKFCETEEEFEATWKHMMDNYNIGNQKWFQKIYKLRHKWAFAFSKDTFTAGLSATSRSEGTNSTLKKQIGNITSSLHDCVIGYEEVQNNWREKEKRKDTHSSQNTPASLVPRNPLLKHAASVYTIKIFNLFQKEQVYTMGCELEDQFLYGGPSLRLFKVKSHGDSSRIRTVEFDTEKLEIKCSCHKFENFGILCSHVLKVFDVLKIHSIPDMYIKRRWTKFIKNRVCGERNGVPSESGSGNGFVSDLAFVNYIMREFHSLAERGKAYVDTRQIVTECIHSGKEKMDAWFENLSLNDVSTCAELEAAKDNDQSNPFFARNPRIAKTVGATTTYIRHWDVKSKKGKEKGESSQRSAKGIKRKWQSSQTIETEFPSQEKSVHEVVNTQPPIQLGADLHGQIQWHSQL